MDIETQFLVRDAGRELHEEPVDQRRYIALIPSWRMAAVLKPKPPRRIAFWLLFGAGAMMVTAEWLTIMWRVK